MTRYISARSESERSKAENEWKVMRWQSAMIASMMGKKSYKPTDLFVMESEKTEAVHIDPFSEDSEAVFERMEAEYLKRQKLQ